MRGSMALLAVVAVMLAHGIARADRATCEGHAKGAACTQWREAKLLDRRQLMISQPPASLVLLPNGQQLVGENKKAKTSGRTFVLGRGGLLINLGQGLQCGLLPLAVSCNTR